MNCSSTSWGWKSPADFFRKKRNVPSRKQKQHEGLMEQLSVAEDKVREYDRMKVHESFPVMKLTAELLDEYVEDIEILPENGVRINWK